MNASVFRLPPASSGASSVSDVFDNTGAGSPVSEVVELRGHTSNVRGVAWSPISDGKIASADQTTLHTWDVDVAAPGAKVVSKVAIPKAERDIQAIRWSPHHNGSIVATANDTNVRGWDLRSMTESFCLKKAHEQCARSLDFNPNVPYHLVTAGDDCKLKFWDSRNIAQPLLQLAAHDHWVWSVRYNHSYDQLVLSSGSDSTVALSSVASLAAPLYHPAAEADEAVPDAPRPEAIPDGVVATFDEHEDSVYAAEWSVNVPWVFASVSYDGRVVINHVPRETKYKVWM